MSQKHQILNHLNTHKVSGIDSMTALRVCNCFRLAARINDLRNDGYDIKTQMKRSAYNKNVFYALYTLTR